MKYLSVAALFCISFAALPSPARSQATGSGGTIRGTVTDPSGAVVAGAEITITNVVTDYKQAVKTDTDGTFRLINIPPNQYHLSVALSGFQTYTQDISVRTQVPIQLKISLVLASATETVNVEATPDTIENVPASHTDVTQNLMADLPLSSPGQGLSDTITMTSGGVVADSNGFFHPQGDHGETTYVVDGQPISDQQNKVFSTQLPANAFQSLELISTGISAEYGDKTSLVVNTVTRSGLGQKPNGSFDAYYGSFGTVGQDATFGIGGAKWGNFLVADSSRTGRFLDTPEFTAFHAKGNTASIWDRADYVPNARDSLHLNAFVARNWFQIPNTYDQLQQDQRQQARTLDLAVGYQHTFGASSLLTVDPFFREDHLNYYPSRDPFDDSPATIDQDRHLTNWGTRADFSYSHGIHDVKVGTQLSQTRLIENFGLGITDPAFNPVCLTTTGAPVTIPTLTIPSACGPLGYLVNPNLSPGLIPFDLTRGGTLFTFHGTANINQQAFYAMDQMTIKNLTLNLGLRFDNYDGISTDNLLQPRVGFSYLFKSTSTVVRASYTRAMETPYNENLVLSSATGAGGLALGASSTEPLRPGHRNEYSAGLEQAIMKFLRVDATYFWKFTKGAFDFDTLLNTSIAFPIQWRQSKIDGANVQISTTNMHGFMAYSSLGHTRARFFGPETGGLIFNSPLNTGVFRIDHDQAFQATNYIRYQHGKDGVWAMFTWRYDSGEVAGAVTDLADALALTAAEQAVIGFHCGNDVATVYNHINSCSSGNYGATRLVIPAPGTFDPDHNPPRISPRNILDIGLGTDNLLHKEKVKTTLKFTIVNITNEAALYNFLSTFSGTHWVAPRTYQLTLGWVL